MPLNRQERHEEENEGRRHGKSGEEKRETEHSRNACTGAHRTEENENGTKWGEGEEQKETGGVRASHPRTPPHTAPPYRCPHHAAIRQCNAASQFRAPTQRNVTNPRTPQCRRQKRYPSD
eukprot:2626797-Rhodomonas_salina.3